MYVLAITPGFKGEIPCSPYKATLKPYFWISSILLITNPTDKYTKEPSGPFLATLQACELDSAVCIILDP